jgi:hypothetical protein
LRHINVLFKEGTHVVVDPLSSDAETATSFCDAHDGMVLAPALSLQHHAGVLQRPYNLLGRPYDEVGCVTRRRGFFVVGVPRTHAYRRKMWCALGCRGAGMDKGDVLVDACEPAVAVGVRRLIEEQLALRAEGRFCIGAIPRAPEPKRGMEG